MGLLIPPESQRHQPGATCAPSLIAVTMGLLIPPELQRLNRVPHVRRSLIAATMGLRIPLQLQRLAGWQRPPEAGSRLQSLRKNRFFVKGTGLPVP